MLSVIYLAGEAFVSESFSASALRHEETIKPARQDPAHEGWNELCRLIRLLVCLFVGLLVFGHMMRRLGWILDVQNLAQIC